MGTMNRGRGSDDQDMWGRDDWRVPGSREQAEDRRDAHDDDDDDAPGMASRRDMVRGSSGGDMGRGGMYRGGGGGDTYRGGGGDTYRGGGDTYRGAGGMVRGGGGGDMYRSGGGDMYRGGGGDMYRSGGGGMYRGGGGDMNRGGGDDPYRSGGDDPYRGSRDDRGAGRDMYRGMRMLDRSREDEGSMWHRDRDERALWHRGQDDRERSRQYMTQGQPSGGRYRDDAGESSPLAYRSGFGASGMERIAGGATYGSSWQDNVGPHRGKGPRNFTRSDERIRELVCERLADDEHVDASQIDVKVENGEVVLTGIVEDRHMKRMAEDVIEELPGVQEVVNQLRTRRGMFGRKAPSIVDQLDAYLRGELAALETYKMALEKLDKGSTARGELERCMQSHEERIGVLRAEITRRGGTPSTSSGPWGVFAKTIEGGARLLGDKVAIAALEEGEDHGLKDYRNVEKLEPELQAIVRTRLLPAQEDTHNRMSTLKHRLS